MPLFSPIVHLIYIFLPSSLIILRTLMTTHFVMSDVSNFLSVLQFSITIGTRWCNLSFEYLFLFLAPKHCTGCNLSCPKLGLLSFIFCTHHFLMGSVICAGQHWAPPLDMSPSAKSSREIYCVYLVLDLEALCGRTDRLSRHFSSTDWIMQWQHIIHHASLVPSFVLFPSYRLLHYIKSN